MRTISLSVRLIEALPTDDSIHIKMGDVYEKWMSPPNLKPYDLVSTVVSLKNSKDPADLKKFVVQARALYDQADKFGLIGSDYTDALQRFVKDPSLASDVRKVSFYNFLTIAVGRVDQNHYGEVELLLNQFTGLPRDLKQQIRNEMLQWRTSSNVERKQAIVYLQNEFAKSKINSNTITDIINLFGPDADLGNGKSFLHFDSAVRLSTRGPRSP